MKAVRERMRKSLVITTRNSGIGSGKHKNLIRTITAPDFSKLYTLGTQVMESTNSGMTVLFGTRLVDGTEVVIKVREKAKSFKSATEEREWRSTTEVQLNMPRVDQLCEYLEVLETTDHYFIVMEKVGGKDLFEHMASEKPSAVEARVIIRQVLEALKVMHGCGRIHKDLKLENVMVDMESPKKVKSASSNGGGFPAGSASAASAFPDTEGSPAEVKLIDFDTVQDWEPTSPKAKDVLGTDGYIAPEAYDGDYSPASDVYCVGVIMYKLLTGKFPSRAAIFDDAPGENWVGSPAMKRIKERLRQETMDFARPPLDRMPEAAELCSHMLAFEVADRPSAEEALTHAWFKLDSEVMSPKSSSTRRNSEDRKKIPGTVSSASSKD